MAEQEHKVEAALVEENFHPGEFAQACCLFERVQISMKVFNLYANST